MAVKKTAGTKTKSAKTTKSKKSSLSDGKIDDITSFDLISGEEFNVIAESIEEELNDKILSSEIKESIRNASFADIVNSIFNISTTKTEKVFDKETNSIISVKKTTPPRLWHTFTDYTLSTNFFMVNQCMSHLQPLQAQFFNHKDINGADVLKFIKSFLQRKYSYNIGKFVPKGFYPTRTKEEKELKITSITGKENKAISIDTNTIKEYCKYKKISLRDYEDLCEFYGPERIENEVAKFVDLNTFTA